MRLYLFFFRAIPARKAMTLFSLIVIAEFPLLGQHHLSTQINQMRTTVAAEKYSLFTRTSVRTHADSSFNRQAVIAKMSINEAERLLSVAKLKET